MLGQHGITTPMEAYLWRNDHLGILEGHATQIAENNNMPLKVYRAMTKAMSEAAPVLWLDEMRQAAISGYEHFRGYSLSESSLRPPAQLWIPSHDLVLDAKNRETFRIPEGLTLSSILIFTQGEYVHSFHIYAPEMDLLDTITPDEMKQWHNGKMPDRMLPVIRFCARRLTAEDDNDAKMFAMIEFMNLPMVSVEPQNLPRPERRRLEKAGKAAPQIRVVLLRRKEGIKDGHSYHVDWSCRWIVGGHWRKQWYPSTAEHKPIFIAPYVKGPENKPLNPDSGERVYVVSR